MAKSTALVPLEKRRQRDLNPVLIAKICHIVSAGNYRTAAYRKLGIADATFKDWLERGDEDAKAGWETPYSALVTLLKAAEAEAEVAVVKKVVDAADNPAYWAAGMTYLERKHPDRWGRRERRQTELGPGQERITVTRIEIHRPAPSQEKIE